MQHVADLVVLMLRNLYNLNFLMLYRKIKSHQNVHFSLILFQFILILHQGEPLKLSKVCEGILDNIGKELLFEVRAHDG